MRTMTEPTPPSDPAEAAAFWYARLHAGEDAETRRGFARWRLASADNRRAWDRVERAGADVDALAGHPALAAHLAAARRGTPPPVRAGRGFAGYALAASVLLALLGGAVFVAAPRLLQPPAQQAAPAGTRYATAIGERRTIALPDGTRVLLDTDSALFVPDHWGAQRNLTLLHGQALFDVAKDKAHPFIVTSRGRSVQALGTRFVVRDEADRFSVALLEGKVRVDLARADAPPRILVPGDTLNLDGGTLTLRHDHAETEAAWSNGHISFDARPLADIVTEMNRYSRQKIVLTDGSLGQKTFSGTFALNAEGGHALVAALQGYGLVRIARQDENEIRLAPR